MKNKTLGIGLLVSISIALLTAIFETSMTIYTADNLFTLCGIGIIFFGIWGSIKLIKNNN